MERVRHLLFKWQYYLAWLRHWIHHQVL